MYLICILSKNNWITRKEGTNQFCSNVLQQSRITLRIAETGWLWELSTLLIRANTSNIFPSDGQENNNIFQCNRLLGHLLAIYKYLTNRISGHIVYRPISEDIENLDAHSHVQNVVSIYLSFVCFMLSLTPRKVYKRIIYGVLFIVTDEWKFILRDKL